MSDYEDSMTETLTEKIHDHKHSSSFSDSDDDCKVSAVKSNVFRVLGSGKCMLFFLFYFVYYLMYEFVIGLCI